MKKTFLQKLALVFSVAIALVYTTIYACGGGDYDWSWEYETNFTPETFTDAKFTPFFLSQELFYDETGLSDVATLFDGDVQTDWATFLNNKLSLETISFFISNAGIESTSSLYEYYSKNKSSKIVSDWSKKIDLKDKKVKEFIEFLHFAKPIEAYSTSENSWNYENEPKRMDDAIWVKMIEKKYNQTSDKFLKNRYWFQVIKAYFYSNNPIDAEVFFNKTEQLQPKNVLYYRAVSYLAGINSRLGDTATANYLYSKVFDKLPKLQTIAMFCFAPKEEKDWIESLNMAKNDEEKIALWAIQGYYNDEEKAIENIYNLNPKSDYLEFLLTRLINNEEIRINKTFKNQSVVQNKLAIKDTISKTVVALIDKMAQSGKVNKPYLWNVAAGYLQTLDGNFAKADLYFAKAEKEMPKTELAISQVRLLKFVNNLSKIDALNAKNETTILQDLNWLYFELTQSNLDNFRFENAANWSRNYIAALYKTQNNPVLSEAFLRDRNFYSSNTNLLAMKNFILKTNKTKIEEIASKIYEVKLDDILDYQTVLALYQNKILEAIAFMEQTNEVKNEIFQGNPFNGNIKDCHDCDFVAFQKRKYTQLEFLKTMQVMKDKIAKNEDVHTNSLLLANAFYNVTHYGNARSFYEGTIIGYGSTQFDFEDYYQSLITNCSMSKKYYQMAFLAAKTNEQKAKCTYMMSKCERNDYYNGKYANVKNYWEVENNGVDFIAFNGFITLKKEYSNTNFYQEVIAECGYFNTFINQNK